jgi:FdhD protein
MSVQPFRRTPIERLTASAGPSHETDEVVTEEPLEIRVAGDTVATTMRTPGHDRELALGFLFAEGIIASVDEVGSVAHCGRTGDAGRFNTIEVLPAPGTTIDVEKMSAARRGTLTTAACGVCGRRSIDDLLARCVPRPGAATSWVGRRDIVGARDLLTGTQPTFARTGGCHGAALVRRDGSHMATFEDVGRHNAVDKLIGSERVLRRQELGECVLMVSGRVSFEIVQKAIVAGVGVLAGVSAASSLAIDLATRANVTLVGFVRGDSLAVYAGTVEA